MAMCTRVTLSHCVNLSAEEQGRFKYLLNLNMLVLNATGNSVDYRCSVVMQAMVEKQINHQKNNPKRLQRSKHTGGTRYMAE